MRRTPPFALVGAIALAAIAPAAHGAARLATGSSTPYTVSPGQAGGALSAGPDGNIWFGTINVGSPGGGIGSMSTGGAPLANFPLPSSLFPLPYQDVGALSAGPDGRLWFMQGSGPGAAAPVGAMTTGGQYSVFPTPPGTTAGRVIPGPDGNMWATAGSALLKVSLAGAITPMPLPAGTTTIPLAGLVAGTDGALWFSGFQGQAETAVFGRMTTNGQVTTTVVPRPAGVGTGMDITVPAMGNGPDGTVWAVVGSVSEATDMTGPGAVMSLQVSAPPTTIAGLASAGCSIDCTLVTGPDGNAWFPNGSGITRVTAGGAVRSFPIISRQGTAQPTGLAVGPDRNLWFANGVDGNVWTLAMSGGAPVAVPRASRINGFAGTTVRRGSRLRVSFAAGASASGATSVIITRGRSSARLWRGTVRPGRTYTVSGVVPRGFARGTATVRLVTPLAAGRAAARVAVR
jgi:streptogramin lyase